MGEYKRQKSGKELILERFRDLDFQIFELKTENNYLKSKIKALEGISEGKTIIIKQLEDKLSKSE